MHNAAVLDGRRAEGRIPVAVVVFGHRCGALAALSRSKAFEAIQPLRPEVSSYLSLSLLKRLPLERVDQALLDPLCTCERRSVRRQKPSQDV